MVTPFVIWGLHEASGLSWPTVLITYVVLVATFLYALMLVRHSRRGSKG